MVVHFGGIEGGQFKFLTNSMHATPTEIRNGYRWLFGAGLVAIGIASFLYLSDELLTHSHRERELGRALYELRTAQSGVGTGESDERIGK
jgi:hypothetical protein